MARASWFRRLFGGAPEPASLPAPPPPSQPQTLGSEEEVFLAQLVQDLGDGKRRDQVGTAEVLTKLDGLWASGHERLAIEWMEKLLGVPEIPEENLAPVRAKLVERYEQRGELQTAIPHLEQLITIDQFALRAHYLLAEHARRREDHERALRHYEAVLGRDVDYPNVRVRVERLRQLTGRAAPVAGETIAAGDVVGVQAGMRYRLVRELGRGATGVVYLARDAELDRDVAIKLLHPHLAGTQQQDAVDRFFHEARVMAALRHPNLVAVLDLDEASRRIVMELAAGGTLRDLLRERGPRTLRRAIERHTQVLSALAAAHRRGIIHCDLKPGNLMFRRDADKPGVEVILGDFGVAHLPDEKGTVARPTSPTGDAELMRRAEAVGTLAYMAPEQRRGEFSAASDVYASAVVLYEMFTGHVPWNREQMMAGTRRPGDFQIPRAIFQDAPSLSDAVQQHIDGLANPDPAKRPSTFQALAEANRLKERIIAAGAA